MVLIEIRLEWTLEYVEKFIFKISDAKSQIYKHHAWRAEKFLQLKIREKKTEKAMKKKQLWWHCAKATTQEIQTN